MKSFWIPFYVLSKNYIYLLLNISSQFSTDNLDIMWIKLVEQNIDIGLSDFKFWDGINVLIERPHILNRKLLGTDILQKYELNSLENPNAYINEQNFPSSINQAFSSNEMKLIVDAVFMSDNDSNANENKNNIQKCSFYLRKLIPRNLIKFTEVLEIIIEDKRKSAVTFWPKESDVSRSKITPTFPYQIKLVDNRLIIETYRKSLQSDTNEKASECWIKSCVLPKLIKWCRFSPVTAAIPSLTLVSVKSYSENYNYLKDKYGKKYVEIWPECSDPIKYVYEDIAIAAYLMTLWERERIDLNLSSKQSFVDLGCGNGLLVDILTSEEYPGIGIDVRRRKIWDLYKKDTTLIEKAIEPSDYSIFPNFDWIIGNHSDELTPWIPVIAARSSYNMRVFLLPCCAFTFNGKYERCSQEKTQYLSYLSFIQSLCECMGFIVKEDKLRIPSTKRTCLICTSRNYKEEDEKIIDERRRNFIEKHSKKKEPLPVISNNEAIKHMADEQKITTEETGFQENINWIADFKPRDRIEIVQNCSQLDKKFLENTVLVVASMLLKTENYINLERGSESILWNCGGKITLSDLIQQIDPHILKCMKNQCGGFQTFLRNHRNVFQFTEGYVHLTVPVKGIPLNNKATGKRKRKRGGSKQYNFQEKPCFFFFHHPQGCPLQTADCNFCHLEK